ncbi:MAG: DUF3054 domain-containing protein [Actinomycetota bacterium]|nr:DUF3054 domain-containing protein [Actinomycetota bacterium]
MTTSRWWGAAAVDMIAVALFVVIGRASHRHAETAAGIASTAWPFAVGLGTGWAILAARGRRRGERPDPATLSSGVAVCAATVACGMALRVVAGQGTAPTFIGVATGFLGALMLGGRAALGAATQRQAARQ